MKSPDRRKSRQDIDVPRDPRYAGFEAAARIQDAAEEEHIRVAHGGDAYEPGTQTCKRCRELEETDELLQQRFFDEP